MTAWNDKTTSSVWTWTYLSKTTLEQTTCVKHKEV